MEKRGWSWRGVLNDAAGLAFATIWAVRGAMAAGLATDRFALAFGAIDLILMAGFLRRDIILRRPEIVHDPRLSRRVRIVRAVLLAIVGNLANMLHRPDLLLPVMGFIIGASYLPLARALREPVHLWVGSLVIVFTLASCALAPAAHLEVAGLGTAFVVWGGCVARLWRSERAPDPMPEPA